MMKKMLSLLLAIAMIISMMPTVLAADTPALVYRYATMSPDGDFGEASQYWHAWDGTPKGYSNFGHFYFYDGTDYTSLSVNDLSVSNNGVATVESAGTDDYVCITAQEYGDEIVSYTAADGVTYTLTITVLDPNAAALVFHYMYWDQNNDICEETYDETSWTGSPNSGAPVRFYFFDGTDYTRLSASDLTINDDLVCLEYDEEGDYYHLMGNVFGTGTLDYVAGDGTVYSISVDVGLPDWGFYTRPETKEEYYISDGFTVTEDCNQFYYVALDGGVVSEITLDEDFDAIADAVISDDGSYVTFTVTGTPGGRWYHFNYSGVNRWGGTFNGWGDGIQLNNGIPGAGVRYAGWENGELVARPWSEFDSAPRDGIASNPAVIFYYGTADSCAPIENIVSVTAADPAILTVSYWQDTVDGLPAYSLDFLKPGTTDLVVITEDGTEYRVPYTIELTNPWLFSTADFDEDTAITSFTVTEDSDTFYFVCEDGSTMDAVTVEADYADAFEIERVSATAFSIQVVDDSMIPSGYRVSFTAEYTAPWGSDTFNVWFEMFNAMPRLVFRHIYWNNGVPLENEYNENRWETAKGYSSNVHFYFFDGENYTRLYADQLTASGVVSIEEISDEDYTRMEALDFGTGSVSYTTGGETYSVSVTVGLPEFGFYSTPYASQEGFLANGFTVTEDNSTVYFCAKSGYTITEFTFTGVDEGVATAELNADGTCITITFDKTTDFAGHYQLRYSGTQGNWSFSDWRYGISIQDGLPGLVFLNTWWNGEEYVESAYSNKNWSAEPGRAQGRFYFFDGENYTRVYASELTTGNANVAYLEDSGDMELSYILAMNFGETTVEYTHSSGKTYSFPVSVVLPNWGFYSEPEAKEEYYLYGGFDVTKVGDVFYLVTTEDKETLTNIALDSDFEEIADAEIILDGKAVKITVTGTPDNRDYGLWISGTYGDGGTFERYCYITLINTMPRLVYRYVDRDENGDYVDYDWESTQWSTAKGYGSWVRFYLAEGDVYTRLTIDQLSVSDSSVVSLTERTDGDFIYINAEGFGEAEVIYTAEDGTVYSLPVSVVLPDYGFYTDKTASTEAYIDTSEGFTVSEENNVFYLVGTAGNTISSVTLNEAFDAIADVEVAEDGTYATITVTGIPEDRWYGLSYAGETEWGYQFTEWWDSLRLKDGRPALVYHYIGWTADGEMAEDNVDMTVWNGTINSGSTVNFYFRNNGTYTKLSLEDLTIGDESVVRVYAWSDRGLTVICEDFGETTISYTAEDGTVYSIPVIVGFNEFDFYTTPYASEESHINEFTVTDDNNVFYLAYLDGWSATDVKLSDELAAIATAEVAEDGSCIKFTVTGDFEEELYNFWHSGTTPYGWDFEEWGYGIYLIDGRTEEEEPETPIVPAVPVVPVAPSEPEEPEEEVVENEDGSTTTTVTDEETGTVTETTTTTEGVTGTVVTDSEGNVTEVTAEIPADVDTTEPVTIPVEVSVSDETTITVTTNSEEDVTVEITVSDVTPGTVIVVVDEEGNETVLPQTALTENGVAAAIPDGATIKVVDNSKDFADVEEDSWHNDAIDFVSARNIMNGTGDGQFTPDSLSDRAMVWTMMARLDGEDTTTGETWYEAGQEWAVENGISDGTQADESITREQIITMLWRYAGMPTASDDLGDYTDADDISDWASEAMRWAVSVGLVNGYGDGTLKAQNNATRAEVAQLFMNYMAL